MRGVTSRPPQIHNPEGDILDNIGYWQEVCEIYTARGNETVVIIGNFSAEIENPIRKVIERLSHISDPMKKPWSLKNWMTFFFIMAIDSPHRVY